MIMEFKGIISQLIDLYNGQTNFDLSLITHDLFTQKLLFTDALAGYKIYQRNVVLIILSLMHQLIYKGIC